MSFGNWVCNWSWVKSSSVFIFYQNFKKVCIFLSQWSVTFKRMMRRQCRSKSRVSWNWGLSWQRLDKLPVSDANGLLFLLLEKFQVSIGVEEHRNASTQFISGIIPFYHQLVELQFFSRKLGGPLNSVLSWSSFLQVRGEPVPVGI